MKRYTPKDIKKLTGLTRKHLYDYKDSIPPVERTNDAGYGLYDEDGLNKLIMASFFADLGMTPAGINKIFGADSYDQKAVLNNLLTEARQKRSHLDDIITVAEVYEDLDFDQMPYNPIHGRDLHATAESIRMVYGTEEYSRFYEMGKEGLDKELFQIFREFKPYRKAGKDPEEAREPVEKILSFIQNTLQVENDKKALTAILYMVLLSKTMRAKVEKKAGAGMADYIAEAIFFYQLSLILDGFEELTETLEDLPGRPYDAPETDQAVQLLKELMEKGFGISTYSEIATVLYSGLASFEQDETIDEKIKDSLQYLYDAVKYREEAENLPKEKRSKAVLRKSPEGLSSVCESVFSVPLRRQPQESGDRRRKGKPGTDLFPADPLFQSFPKNSLLFRRAKKDHAEDLLEGILYKKAVLNLELNDVAELEKRAREQNREIGYEYLPEIPPDEEAVTIMEEWGEKYRDAEKVLLFIEGCYGSAPGLAHRLMSRMDCPTILLGVKLAVPGKSRMIAAFL